MQKKNIVKINIVILGCFFIGFVLAIQLQSTKPFALASLSSVREIEKQVSVELEELESIKNLIISKEKELNDYSSLTISEFGKSIESSLNNKKAYAGASALLGEGIILKISDSNRDLDEGENPNNLIVHDQDIITLINDLKVGGAEALAINGERLMSNTEIKCSGATITINNKTYGQPFIITAIGNKEQLVSSVMAPDTYGYLLTQVYGIIIDVSEKEEINIPAYDVEIEYLYRKDDVQ